MFRPPLLKWRGRQLRGLDPSRPRGGLCWALWPGTRLSRLQLRVELRSPLEPVVVSAASHAAGADNSPSSRARVTFVTQGRWLAGGGTCRSPQRREQVWRVSTGSKVTRHLCPLFFGPATSHGHLRAGKGRLPRSGPRAQDPPRGWHWWPPWSVACWSIPIIAFPSPSLFQDFSSPSFLSYNYSMTIVGT